MSTQPDARPQRRRKPLRGAGAYSTDPALEARLYKMRKDTRRRTS